MSKSTRVHTANSHHNDHRGQEMEASTSYISVGCNRASSVCAADAAGVVAFGAGRFVAVWDPAVSEERAQGSGIGAKYPALLRTAANEVFAERCRPTSGLYLFSKHSRWPTAKAKVARLTPARAAMTHLAGSLGMSLEPSRFGARTRRRMATPRPSVVRRLCWITKLQRRRSRLSPRRREQESC